MSEETLFEKLDVKYIEKDGIFYPLITSGGEENSTDVGKYGRMWMDYIQKGYPQRYRSLVRFGELHDKAAEVNEVAYGEGSIGHNTRRFIADNVDASRTPNNITLIHEDIKQAYHKLFDKALKEYNAKQKRKDRQIKSYYDKISRSKQEKLFYEVIVQIFI